MGRAAGKPVALLLYEPITKGLYKNHIVKRPASHRALQNNERLDRLHLIVRSDRGGGAVMPP